MHLKKKKNCMQSWDCIGQHPFGQRMLINLSSRELLLPNQEELFLQLRYINYIVTNSYTTLSKKIRNKFRYNKS